MYLVMSLAAFRFLASLHKQRSPNASQPNLQYGSPMPQWGPLISSVTSLLLGVPSPLEKYSTFLYLIFRPPDIIVGGLTFYNGFFLFLSSFFLSSIFRRLISELAERNSTKIGHMLESNCNLKRMSKIWGIHSPYKSGPQNHLSDDFAT